MQGEKEEQVTSAFAPPGCQSLFFSWRSFLILIADGRVQLEPDLELRGVKDRRKGTGAKSSTHKRRPQALLSLGPESFNCLLGIAVRKGSRAQALRFSLSDMFDNNGADVLLGVLEDVLGGCKPAV